jgi:acetyl esterase/lipase
MPVPRFSRVYDEPIWEGWTVTYAALQLAYFMGFKNIFLVGLDHSFKVSGSPNEEQAMQGADPNHFDPRYFAGSRWHLPDLEGSEATTALNRIGISVFVLRYRTTPDAADKPWARPLQDSQRAIRTLRSQAKKWNLDTQKIGLLGFSAGGQVAAIHLTQTEPAYTSIDEIDKSSFRPDFAMLIYPWRIYDGATDDLISPIKVGKETPPTFLVHTHDDQSTSLGAVMFYARMKKQNLSSELHVYQNGGHGYGVRARPKSAIGTWQDRAIEWLELRELGRASE